ncbi:MAG: hypothetical protein AB8B91_00980, partial [Rubripirellula sp.]
MIHQLPPLDDGQGASCTRCQSTVVVHTPSGQSASRTAAAAIGALLLFWPAILLPILQIEAADQRRIVAIPLAKDQVANV